MILLIYGESLSVLAYIISTQARLIELPEIIAAPSGVSLNL